ncbi:MAG TPA: chromate efflux transporter [Nocardioides sp.]|nr:chromate efflux transporter [Nocardioides sp.]
MGRDRDVIPLREATRAWASIAAQTFGGPAGQIAVMQHKLVDELRWIGQRRFLHALNYCMLLPGPEAQQLAIYTGWLLNGTAGGLIAGTLFVLPGVVALLALSAIYVGFGDVGVVSAVFAGIGPAVIAIVLQAVVRVGSRALRHRLLVGLAVLAFVALAVLRVPFPVVVLGSGVIGWLLGLRLRELGEPKEHGTTDGPAPLVSDDLLHHSRPSPRRTLALFGGGAVVWLAPVAVLALVLGRGSTIVDEGVFFSGTALVTFGGAYAVLSYVAQQAVHVYGWLAPNEMVRGLGLAESTPGPLIMVVQFVAFLGAYRSPGSLDPWVAAVVGSFTVTWVTFVPCFVLVLGGAPYVERLRANRHLTAALTAITAAVVGVIANLAVFFAVHTLFTRTRTLVRGPVHVELPVLGAASGEAFALTAACLVAMFGLRWGPLRVLGLGAGSGVAWWLVSLL